jgi:carboxymethylenebutenolidase
MGARRVSFSSNGETTDGFLAVPESGQGPGVMVIQEWWGLVPHIEDVCRRFAKEGFVALSPDLYHGRATKSPDEAGKLMMALDIDRAETDLRGAVTYLENLPAVTSEGVGVVGFCMGGQLALCAATQNPEVLAAVDFYGIHSRVKLDFTSMRAAVLGFFGENDKSVPPAAVRALEQQIREAGKDVETHIYPGAQHAFFNDTRPEVYDATAARDAWTRLLEFFRKRLA